MRVRGMVLCVRVNGGESEGMVLCVRVNGGESEGDGVLCESEMVV